MSDLEDNLFKTPLSSAGGFRFDEKVALVFPDMIRRSVPGYGHIVGSSGLIAKRYAKANTVIYDLGCSLGATTLAIAGEVDTDAVSSLWIILRQCWHKLGRECLNP